jgi:hypothetical protein
VSELSTSSNWSRQNRAPDPHGHTSAGGQRREHQRGVGDRDPGQVIGALLEVADDLAERRVVALYS